MTVRHRAKIFTTKIYKMHYDLRIHTKHPQTNRQKINKQKSAPRQICKKKKKNPSNIRIRYFFFIVNDRYSIRYLKMAAGVASPSWKFNINNIMSYTGNTLPARRCGSDGLRRTRVIAFTSVHYDYKVQYTRRRFVNGS